jgi:hypothetical protein
MTGRSSPSRPLVGQTWHERAVDHYLDLFKRQPGALRSATAATGHPASMSFGAVKAERTGRSRYSLACSKPALALSLGGHKRLAGIASKHRQPLSGRAAESRGARAVLAPRTTPVENRCVARFAAARRRELCRTRVSGEGGIKPPRGDRANAATPLLTRAVREC